MATGSSGRSGTDDGDPARGAAPAGRTRRTTAPRSRAPAARAAAGTRGTRSRARPKAKVAPTAHAHTAPDEPFRLVDIEPGRPDGLKKKAIAEELARHRGRIAALQARLYAEQRRSLLIVLQAMDTGGKDGTIKHVFQGVNPQGCQVWSFKQPSVEELAHDFLWRYHAKVPTKGMITIFNRSHYEDVLVVRVRQLVPEEVWAARYDAINQFELALTQAGVTVLKFFLHISKDEQKRRLERRLDNPDKYWKFSRADLAERKRWDDYQVAYQDAIMRCSTPHAPWYVVPSNSRRYRNLVVARAIAGALEAMQPQFPPAESSLGRVHVDD